MTNEIEWGESEWDKNAQAAYHAGMEASVSSVDFGWSWQVVVTSEISEWPECVDAGLALSEAAAKVQAEATLREYASHYSKINH